MEKHYDIVEKIPLDLYPTFSFEKAVCNHGLFMMAPNHWIPSTKTLQRPLRLSDSTSLPVSISYRSSSDLIIRVHNTQCLSFSNQNIILDQVRRMLRISKKDENDVMEFHKLHPQAKQSGFGRIFRSPTLFEDIVKSILLCNCGWGRTLEMAEALCVLQSEIANAEASKRNNRKKQNSPNEKRKRTSNTVSNDEQISLGNFPNSQELAALHNNILKIRCNVGYRADYIIQVSIHFQNDNLKFIKEFEDSGVLDRETYDDIFTALLGLKGFGPFTCANILMCCGSYERIPEDSETARHLSTCHAITKDCKKKNVTDQVYGKYAPFQCLAYWWELFQWYEENFGKLSELPRSSYSIVTGTTTKGRKKFHV